ncbi:hypothetical protein [Niveispirillum sp.]|uniref:hypothetical protein n=1 Tax=Niveispirillum sp. TaxID=1917217 RepID=UPI001B6D7F04|nr:hypothetical protein [Niveispirillum sp.]MBP7336382.1 hypothetical protein [Niveispirillum sp.]
MENNDLILDEALLGEASLGELLSDPIAVLLMDRDGVVAEDVLRIVRLTAVRIASNDCGSAAAAVSAA